jgi:hypothetical protein
MRKLLFVPAAPRASQALEEALRSQRGRWQWCIVSSARMAQDRLAENDWDAVVADLGGETGRLQGLFGAIDYEEQRMTGRFHPYRVHTRVGATIACHVFQGVDDAIDAFKIDCLRADIFGHMQAFGNSIDRDNSFRSEQEGASYCELTHGAATPNGDGVSSLYIAIRN